MHHSGLSGAIVWRRQKHLPQKHGSPANASLCCCSRHISPRRLHEIWLRNKLASTYQHRSWNLCYHVCRTTYMYVHRPTVRSLSCSQIWTVVAILSACAVPTLFGMTIGIISAIYCCNQSDVSVHVCAEPYSKVVLHSI